MPTLLSPLSSLFSLLSSLFSLLSFSHSSSASSSSSSSSSSYRHSLSSIIHLICDPRRRGRRGRWRRWGRPHFGPSRQIVQPGTERCGQGSQGGWGGWGACPPLLAIAERSGRPLRGRFAACLAPSFLPSRSLPTTSSFLAPPQSLLSGGRQLPVARVVQSLLEASPGPETDGCGSRPLALLSFNSSRPTTGSLASPADSPGQ